MELLQALRRYSIEAKSYCEDKMLKPESILIIEKYYGLKSYKNGLERE